MRLHYFAGAALSAFILSHGHAQQALSELEGAVPIHTAADYRALEGSGQLPGSLEATARALSIFAEHPALAEGDPRAVANCHVTRARALLWSGEYENADAELQRAIELQRELAADSPADPVLAGDLLQSMNLLVAARSGRGGGQPEARSAVELGRSQLATNDGPRAAAGLTRALVQLAWATHTTDPDGALTLLREATALADRVAKYGVRYRGRDLASATRQTLAMILRQRGELAAAKRIAKRAIEQSERSLADTPDDAELLNALASRVAELSTILLASEEWRAALAAAERASALSRRATTAAPAVTNYQLMLQRSLRNEIDALVGLRDTDRVLERARALHIEFAPAGAIYGAHAILAAATEDPKSGLLDAASELLDNATATDRDRALLESPEFDLLRDHAVGSTALRRLSK